MTNPLKIVIPMAGFGSRLRPLTWSKPKPLVSLAGKTVLDYVLDMFRSVPDFDSAEFVFILGPTMGEQIKEHAAKHYPKVHVDYAVQPEMKGQSDAFWHAREYLHGPMLMAYSDTLIENDFSFLDKEQAEGIAWVKPVPDPRRFGVAELNQDGWVTKLIEKPADVKNNLVLVGCYYFSEAEDLISAIEEQIERKITLKGEYYVADAINILLERGHKMRTENVETWLDAGTSDAILETNRFMLEHGRNNNGTPSNLENTVIIPPVSIHPNAKANASVLGPNLSLGDGAEVQGSILRDSIIGPGAHITDSILEGSLVGYNATIADQSGKFNIGDTSRVIR